MIEIICKDSLQGEEKEEKICLPKNIRQVGSPRGRHKIYIEDYVYTYLKTMAQKQEACAAVFFGKSWLVRDIRYTFISGAVECGAAVFQWDNIRLDDSFWEYIYKEEKKYFPEKQIVGWFLGKIGQIMELSPVVEAAHRKYFSGRDKVLMLMDVLENEEVFFIYEQGYLQKREGYYIYYERNNAMQEYMVSKREEEQRMDKLTAQAAKGKEEELENDNEFQRKHRYKEAEELRKELETDSILSKKRGQKEAKELQKELETDNELQKKQVQKGTEELQKELEADSELQRKRAYKEAKKLQKELETDSELQRKHAYKEAKELQKELEADSEDKKKGEEKKELQTDEDEYKKSDEFRELHKELESISDEHKETRRKERIFSKSNLEEPKTQAEQALEAYRNMILEKQGKRIERQNRNFLYTASAFFLVVVCVIGITTINNYRKMQEVEEALHIIKNTETEKQEEKNLQRESELKIESVDSQVEPLEDDSKEQKSEQEKGEKTETEEGETKKSKENQKTQVDKPDKSEQGQDESQETKEEGNSKEENTAKTQETSNGQPAEARYYTVKEGDTLASICIKVYNTSEMMEKVCQANNIENGDKIYVGQELLLP